MFKSFAITALLTFSIPLSVAQAADNLCNQAWFERVERVVQTGDGMGHGPDAGSAEWMSTVEFQLGIPGSSDLPESGSEEWCRHIDRLVFASDTNDAGPSFECSTAREGSMEALVCADPRLSALDRQLAEVFDQALEVAETQASSTLRAEQRGWISGRNECWKSEDSAICVEASYVRRIAELQAHYRLVPLSEWVFYACDGNAAKEVAIAYFETRPRTLIAEFGDSVSLLFEQADDTAETYTGRNEQFTAIGDSARIRWGFDAPVMDCVIVAKD